MNSHLVLKSVVFIVEGLLLMLALAAAVHFEIGRLLLRDSCRGSLRVRRDLRDRKDWPESLEVERQDHIEAGAPPHCQGRTRRGKSR